MAALPEGLSDPQSQPPQVRGLDASGVHNPIIFADQHDELILSYARAGGFAPAPTYRDTPFARALPEQGELVTDLDKLAHIMGSLALTCGTVGLPHLRYGLEGYRAVTVTCTRRLDEFEDGSKIARTMPVFFDELAKPFWNHVNGWPAAVHGWHEVFYSRQAMRAQPAVAMFDFLTDHVGYDLGIALLRTDTEDRHKPDYTQKINTILTDVARSIVDNYAIFHGPLRRSGIDRLCMDYFLQELFTARDEAWQRFEDLSAVQTFPEYVALRHQMKLRTGERLLSADRIASLMVRLATRVPKQVWLDDRLALAEVA